MTAAKIAISIEGDVLRQARREVARGRAKSLSALITAAVDEKLRRDELAAILDVMDAELGKPKRSAITWAKRALRR